ncbi:uncharacterized protein LOC122386819 [Amphibalanus amphitrite]|uniref:uncharacterized protein LOC122386819 n=1 Tax=Amphibalanus amphitrite TaxID=1232801 RepID=UPI001C90C2A0|nr:uncharacterized protein LOC122386819 [Amphibalanus amphitrite]
MFEADFRDEHTEKKVSQEDRRFLRIMEENFHQRADKHFEGPLPLKDQNVKFPDNKKLALKRLFCLKRRLANDKKFSDDYNRFMADSFNKGYAERVPEDELGNDDGRVWFVPHHGVYHAKKGKIRVVYDCSAEYQGFSLNNSLLQGPDFINNLLGVIIRFRKDEVAISCDIQEMFNQVLVTEQHRDLLRFLWWENGDLSGEPVQYRMKTHLFGAVSSPACAMYALNATADTYEQKYGKEAADFVRHNFYVDDGLISVPDADTAARLAMDTIHLCADGGFKLNKFVSNDPSVVASLPPDSVSKAMTSVDVSLHHPTYEQALGLKWNTETDTLHINVDLADKPITRRGILSTVSSLYDPVGLISPVILKGKQFVKLLCCDGYDWDEPVAEDVAVRWLQWRESICLLSDISVPRRYVSNKGKIKIYELHHFSDASTSGYGQVTYLRTIDELGHVCSGLVISKAKVTPKRAVTIPRLELTAAVLSVKVASFLDKKLNIRNLRHFFWTDSMVVLGYIGNESRRFQVFVANRVQQIREHTVPDQWRFVKSEDNPADLASRGLDASELKNCDLWWHGPKFLMDSAELSAEPRFVEVQEDDPEVKKTRVLVTSSRQDDAKFDLSSRLVPFSSWFRAKKAVAICLRYRRRLLNRIRQKRTCSTTTEGMEESKSLTDMPIDTDELNDAEVTILKNVQEDEFEEELVNLATQEDPTTDRKQVKKRSSVRRLDPFLARDGLLRVGGRLRRSDLPLETAHPVILPKDHHVSRLIIAHFHEKTKHSGRTMTLSEIRLSGFWILHGRTAVSRYIQKCVKCIKLRGTPCGQKMADLPEERVGQMEPFTYSGCDCFGPFIIKERRSELKRWGIVFTCMSSRAVHLETLNSLTADAFINAYRRFVSRRGPVRKLFCDNATNFIGGEGYLMAALNEMDRDQVRRTILKDNCDLVEFDHITPRASHMGGAWERQIRSVRAALNSLFQDVGLQIDDELLRTVMTEAEAVVNSRPLSYACMTDSDVVEPITPSQLLTLKQKVVLPLPGNFDRPDLYVRQRWRRVQYLSNQFWLRWRREFLPTLQERRKWNRTELNLEPGDVVIIVDADAPRCSWPLGRVVSTYPSSDGLVRSVRVRIGRAEYDRPIHKVIRMLKS